jgi:2-polyprenyl-6-methoxyphenol hydroxylase-like FAD-dependent oxidoreductase
MVNSRHPVLIIGAGITGLLIAQGLKKANINYKIFDVEPSAQSYRRRDWGMSIHWSRPLLEKLLPQELWNRLPEIQVDPSFDAAAEYSIPFYNAKTGELLKTAPTPNAIRASRRKMRDFCAQGIEVQYNKKLSTVDFDVEHGSVTAIFSDGINFKGCILIGADGHRSFVREVVLGTEKATVSPIPGGIQLVSATSICYNDAEKARHIRQLHPINWAGFHPDFPICTWMASKLILFLMRPLY